MTLLFVLLLLYFLPAIVATVRSHPYVVSVTTLNLFLGWTFLGWVAALVWAVSAQPRVIR